LPGSSPPLWHFKPAGRLTQVSDLTLAGWLAQLTTSTYNQLAQYTGSPNLRHTVMQNLAVTSPALVISIASTHCAHPWRDGQAELA